MTTPDDDRRALEPPLLSPWGRLVRRVRPWGFVLLAIAGIAVALSLFGNPGSGYGDTVTGKHHTAAREECSDGECVIHPETWQLDVMGGRRADTITVDRAVWERYAVGDEYKG